MNPVTSTIGILLGGIGTLAIYSFLYKENRFYRLFEHIFIGVATGWGVVITFREFLFPKFLTPLWERGFAGLVFKLSSESFASQGPAGEFVKRVADTAWYPIQYLWLIPAAFGSLYYTIYSRRHNWMARLVIGFGIGIGGGAAFEGFFSEYLPQIFAAFRPLLVFNSAGGIDVNMSVLNLVITFSMLSTMIYFLFTIDRRRLSLESTASAGRLLMMVSFGAVFGSTVTARLALLIERLQFLTGPWLKTAWPFLKSALCTLWIFS
jgi:hypothetical protein